MIPPPPPPRDNIDDSMTFHPTNIHRKNVVPIIILVSSV